ncbi:MAG: restriction endonuclease subunit S [Pseudomonadota bacterium]|nr:restriction endonuclease subunit S [Pseudomonadota bacterium]
MEVREASARYGVKPSYKQTEIGLIPSDWEFVRLTSVAKLESGHTPSRRNPSYWDGPIPWVSLHDTDALDAPVLFDTAQRVSAEGLANSSARLLPAGTVVFSRTATVGKTTILGRPMATSQDFANYVCGPRVHNRFLVYLFRSMTAEWKKLMAGSIHNTVYMPVFKELRVPLPPSHEQRAIADALSDADAFIESLEQLLAKKRQIKQGAMQELLTGKKRLPGFDGKWERKPLGDLGRWSGGMTPSMQNQTYWYPATVPWISSGDVKVIKLAATAHSVSDQAVKLGATTLVPAESLIVVVRSGILRKYLPVAITTVPMAINQDIKALMPNGVCSPDFLLQALTYLGGDILSRCLKSGTTVESLEFSWLRAFNIDVPPLPEQTAIAAVLSGMDTEIVELESKLTKAREVKQGMMQELLTGRIRLL